MRIPHIDKISPKSAVFCIRFQLFTVLSLTYVTIKYQLFPFMIIWYQIFICVRISYQFFTRVSFDTIFSQMWAFGTDSSHVWGFDTDSSHLWKFGTNSSHLRKIVPVLLTLKNIKWPYVNFTFAKIWRIGTYSSHGVKFTKCEICGSTHHPHVQAYGWGFT